MEPSETFYQGPVDGGYDPDFSDSGSAKRWELLRAFRYAYNHNTADQVKRRQRSRKTHLKGIDIVKCEGFFEGTRGERYAVSLTSCDCYDYKRRRRPCKHIYRLANELLDFESVTRGITPAAPVPPKTQSPDPGQRAAPKREGGAAPKQNAPPKKMAIPGDVKPVSGFADVSPAKPERGKKEAGGYSGMPKEIVRQNNNNSTAANNTPPILKVVAVAKEQKDSPRENVKNSQAASSETSASLIAFLVVVLLAIVLIIVMSWRNPPAYVPAARPPATKSTSQQPRQVPGQSRRSLPAERSGASSGKTLFEAAREWSPPKPAASTAPLIIVYPKIRIEGKPSPALSEPPAPPPPAQASRDPLLDDLVSLD